MSETITSPAPKKSKKKLFFFVAIILGILGYSEYKFNFIFGTDVTVTESSITISDTQDSGSVVSVPIDTTKKDTAK